MSLYRTWRPPTFADLVGQETVVKTLSAAIDSGRLSHAYLFTGPRGSGKTSAAKILARCIECEAGPTSTPCNTCEACRAIFAGTTIDVIEMDAASNGGIDNVRELRETVKVPPVILRQKVLILDEAHMLTAGGSNALLKTLEEPPPNVTFILATTAPESLPVTILSRCQRYTFRRIPIPAMVARMRLVADGERIRVDDEALAKIARRADGALRDALTILEQVAAASTGPIDPTAVDGILGNTKGFARQLRDAALAGDALRALQIVEQAHDASTDMSELLHATIAEMRFLLIGRVNCDLIARDLAPEELADVIAIAPTVPQGRIIGALRLLADAHGATRTSGNARLNLEAGLLRFILQPDARAHHALADRLAALEATDAPTSR